MEKLEFFFQIFRANKVGLKVFRVSLGIVNFFVSTLHALNSITAIKLLAITKMEKLEILVIFEQIRVVEGCSTVL